MSMEDNLRRRWQSLFANLDVPEPLYEPAFQRILDHYGDTARRYHTTEHIAFCLAIYDTVSHTATMKHALEAAIWWHDMVYEPRPGAPNEERSAMHADHELRRLDMSPQFISAVIAIIMATKHDGSANDPDQQLMCDIDLASFARPRSEYRKDCENIRYEYRAVPDNIYRTKRIETLQSFLARPSIYYTCQFRYRFEAAARENLEQEIHDLKVCERVCG